ncbi:MAG: magnesium-translocating P-type ATPase [Caldiserica bacterium]|nr:magnesium-translocating P-type ATPase [Caldisericota bacterium]
MEKRVTKEKAKKNGLKEYWALPLDELARALDANLEKGLTQEEALRRLEEAGPNRLNGKKRLSALSIFLAQFKSPIIFILIFATIISAVVQDFIDAVIIMSIVLVSAILSFIQEYSANNAAEKLKARVSVKCRVIRDNEEKLIPIEEVVPGDIVLLAAGSMIPGDGIVVGARDLFVNQAVLTGETFPAEKKSGAVNPQSSLPERTNMVFMGTSVSSGTGRALIVETGKSTMFGQIAHKLSIRPPMTEFERGIRRLGYLLSEVMFILVIVIFALNVAFKKPVLDSLLFSIALAVGLTPQLLPAIITANLSQGSRLMAKAGVIVRRLSAIENFGSMSVLCTDKTGTITEGVIKLDRALDVNGQPSDLVFQEAYLNSKFQAGLYNPLDEAVVSSQNLDVGRWKKIDEIPYDFVRKRLTVVVWEEQMGSPNQVRMITKGALDNVLAICSTFLQGDRALPLNPEVLERIHQLYLEWSEQGFRVLGVARKFVEPKTAYLKEDEQDMVFIGFLLFFDPPKEGVKDTLLELQSLGIRLKIITGDNRFVAEYAARSIGLKIKRILTGKELDSLDDEALLRVADETDIFAAVDPNQKQRIILALKKMGNVVGFMGDGVNDAPALHSADVGISVENAVDVAKEAADFVLLKRDLEVLKEGIIQGRRTFANTLKYIFMATSANFGNMFSMAGASLFLPFLPLLPKQILLINLLTDLPEMTIALDQVDETYINNPHRWDITFIRRFMLTFGSLSSIFDFATFGLLLLLMRADQALFQTGWFVESVLSAATVIFSLRTRLPFLRNRPAKPLLLATGLVALIVLYLPYSPLSPVMGFKPLPLYFLLSIIGIVVIYFFSAEALKRAFYRKMK